MAPFQILMRQHYFKMSIELPATFIHRYSDMTEKLLKAVLTLHTNTHAHTLLPFSFIQKTGHKFARISFDTVPHKSHAINIDFSIAFWYLYVLSGILVAFQYFGAFRSLYAPLFVRSFRRKFFTYHHAVKHPHTSIVIS